MKDTNENIDSNQKEILKVTENFYREQYEQKQETSGSVPIKVLNQGSKDIPDIREEEITNEIEMKNNKAPGDDDLVKESMRNLKETLLLNHSVYSFTKISLRE